MTTLPDLWAPPLTPNPTHSFRGAGVTTWQSVTIENDTALQLLVSRDPDAPPSTDVATAWRLVPPGANVTWPLGSSGVSYTLVGTPAVGAAVQTILSDTAQPAGGTTGTVNIGSGTVTISGPVDVNVGNTPTVDVAGPVAISSGTVDVQTSAGVSVSTKATQSFVASISVPASGPTVAGPFSVPADTASLLFEWSGVLPLILKVIGVQTGVRYAVLTMDATGYVEVPFDRFRDTQVQVSVQQVTAGSISTLTVSASTATAALSQPILYPYSQAAAIQYGVKNLPIVDYSGKNFFAVALVNAGPATLIPATANTAWAGYSLLCVPDAATAACVIQVGTWVASAAFGPVNFDFRGAIVAVTGAALNVTQIGGPAIWRVSLVAAPITT